MGTSSKLRSAKCAACRGHRLHEVRIVAVAAGGKVSRNLVCVSCESATRVGVACPKCADARFQTMYTRHRAGGVTVRGKKCRGCGHRVRTREVVESGTA